MFNLLRDEKGLTLIEVLIAAVFLTLTSVGVLGTFSSGYIVLRRSEALHKATEMARHKMEEMENIPIEDIYPADGTSTSGGKDILDGTDNDMLDEVEVVGQVVAGSDAIIYCPECGYLNRVTLGTYTATCQNPDKNYDGTSDDTCNTPLPGPGQIGYYTREVRVHAFNEDMTDYNPAGSYVPEQGGGSPLVGDTGCRLAPLKRITVEVKWQAMGEEQSYQIQTLMSRLYPKYGFK